MPSTLTDAPDLVHSSSKTFYPHTIPLRHGQLRHFLKSTESGLTYYATRNEAYALKGGKRKLIARLDFDVQCLTAGFGWLCIAGQEKGQCAFLKLQLRDDADSAEVDASLPVHLQSPPRSHSPEGLRHVRSASFADFPQRAKTIHYKKIGEDVVNAITLQSIVSTKANHERETVAVVASNDTTVTIYSLDKMEEIAVIHYKHQMNHATLSADGELLLACGDINRAFFHTRQKTHFRWTNEWVKLADTEVSQFPKGDCCFTTGISPNQKYGLVASQTGIMVKFDLSRVSEDMRNDKAIIGCFSSSRVAPTTYESQEDLSYWRGAIRSTAYSPRVWEMYAWAEGKGRICIGDLRNLNRPVQLIQLSEKDPEKNTVELTDATQEDGFFDDESFSQTLRRQGLSRPTNSTVRDQLNEVSSAVDYLEDAAYLRRIQQVLRSLDRDDADRSDEQPRLQDLMNEIQEMGDELDNPTGSQGLRIPPRRRPSVVFNRTEQPGSSTSTSSLAPIIAPHSSTLSASPSQLARDRPPANLTPPPPLDQPGQSADTSDPWQTISAAMNAESRSRQVSLRTNLQNLRQTRDSLDRAQRASRIRTEQNTYMARQMHVLERQNALRERQEAARLRAPQPSGTLTGTESATTSQVQRNASDAESRLQADLEQHLDDSSGRLTQLERELERLESRRDVLFRQTTSSSSDHEPGANTQTGSPPGTTAIRNAQRARYQRVINENRLSGGYIPSTDASILLRRRGPGGDEADELDIMGLDWSHDGRLILVATSAGIFELKVNLKGRMSFPAITKLQ